MMKVNSKNRGIKNNNICKTEAEVKLLGGSIRQIIKAKMPAKIIKGRSFLRAGIT